METFTGVRFDSELGEYEVIVCGQIEGHGNTAREAGAKLQDALVWCATVASKTQAPKVAHNAPQAAQSAARVIVAAPVAQAAQRATERPQVKCAWFRLIRAFYGAAQGRKLDTRDEDAMRDALARFVGRNIESRAELKAGEWNADAVRRGQLAW
jgi:hypothetical protein